MLENCVITQKELKKILTYNPETGIFVWLKNKGTARAGDYAGYIQNGYNVIMINGSNFRSHRLAWLYVYGEWPKEQIDHINHNREDNKLINLREVTHQENLKNITLKKNNKSGIMGVGWIKQNSSWRAYISSNKKWIHLGSFNDKFEAICARKSAERKYGFHENHGVSE